MKSDQQQKLDQLPECNANNLWLLAALSYSEISLKTVVKTHICTKNELSSVKFSVFLDTLLDIKYFVSKSRSFVSCQVIFRP